MSRVTVAQPVPRRALIFGEMSERKEGRGKGKGKKKDRGSRGKPAPGEGDPSPGESPQSRYSRADASPGSVCPSARSPRLTRPRRGGTPRFPAGVTSTWHPAFCAHREPGRPARTLPGPPCALLPGLALGPRVGRGAQARSAAPSAGPLPAARALRAKGFARAPPAL